MDLSAVVACLSCQSPVLVAKGGRQIDGVSGYLSRELGQELAIHRNGLAIWRNPICLRQGGALLQFGHSIPVNPANFVLLASVAAIPFGSAVGAAPKSSEPALGSAMLMDGYLNSLGYVKDAPEE